MSFETDSATNCPHRMIFTTTKHGLLFHSPSSTILSQFFLFLGGHFPIPESFLPDEKMEKLAPRSAHPVIRYVGTLTLSFSFSSISLVVVVVLSLFVFVCLSLNYVTAVDQDPTIMPQFPFDKYELEGSPLTTAILQRQQQSQKEFCWHVFVQNRFFNLFFQQHNRD